MQMRWLSEAQVEQMKRNGTIGEGLTPQQVAKLKYNAERAGQGFRLAYFEVPTTAAYTELAAQGYDPPGSVAPVATGGSLNDIAERAVADAGLILDALLSDFRL